ncbi:MAG: succinyl-CoA synthetase subunit beta [Pyrinomonas sp.]|uniref:ATP-grasp domain-containing protein n=1 Tax=Pyrinomonas sp. TaxID=2080306 RepID=UPI00332F5A67
MAKLFEHEGKRALALRGMSVPRGRVVKDPDEARVAAIELGGQAVVKAQVWDTDRARRGGIRFVTTPNEARAAADEIFASKALGQRVESVLVEERLEVAREFYIGAAVDDRVRRLVLLFSALGGSGIEGRKESVLRLPVSVRREPTRQELRHELLAREMLEAELEEKLLAALLILYRTARETEARSIEINPLAWTSDRRLVALDCRLSVDDYAVFRHPELGIEIAREFGHVPTPLERIAWAVERDDYRGTFYFVELVEAREGDGIPIGFHGAGGGGAMASMDAAVRVGLRPLNYADTSGNPAASKVYRAARIILAQPGIKGYFLSGSGVASQEQFHLARALVKAFREEGIRVPAVLRLGGNGEELAAKIMARFARSARAPVETYRKEQSAEFCAQRLRALIEEDRSAPVSAEGPTFEVPPPSRPYRFRTRTGWITYDHAACAKCETKACVIECVPQILKLVDGLPVLAISEEEAARGRCIECLACEVECWMQGAGGGRVELPIPGLDEFGLPAEDQSKKEATGIAQGAKTTRSEMTHEGTGKWPF